MHTTLRHFSCCYFVDEQGPGRQTRSSSQSHGDRHTKNDIAISSKSSAPSSMNESLLAPSGRLQMKRRQRTMVLSTESHCSILASNGPGPGHGRYEAERQRQHAPSKYLVEAWSRSISLLGSVFRFICTPSLPLIRAPRMTKTETINGLDCVFATYIRP